MQKVEFLHWFVVVEYDSCHDLHVNSWSVVWHFLRAPRILLDKVPTVNWSLRISVILLVVFVSKSISTAGFIVHAGQLGYISVAELLLRLIFHISFPDRKILPFIRLFFFIPAWKVIVFDILFYAFHLFVGRVRSHTKSHTCISVSSSESNVSFVCNFVITFLGLGATRFDCDLVLGPFPPYLCCHILPLDLVSRIQYRLAVPWFIAQIPSYLFVISIALFILGLNQTSLDVWFDLFMMRLLLAFLK